MNVMIIKSVTFVIAIAVLSPNGWRMVGVFNWRSLMFSICRILVIGSYVEGKVSSFADYEIPLDCASTPRRSYL
jgi:hypothetical protein